MPEVSLKADAAAIQADFEYMTARWAELGRPAMFEVRAFKEGAQPHTARFAPDWIDEAVDWCASMNALGFNIYAVRNPIRADISGSASDADIIGAFFLWADCDESNSAENVRRWEGPAYSASVVTGLQPTPRVHTYWQLEKPCTDMDEWRSVQVAIAAHFGSDRTVINPSRIMRVAGTISYPFSHKRAKGYVPELVTLRTAYEPPRAPVTLDQMRRAFGATTPATAPAGSSSGAFSIDTGFAPTLDREQARVRALSGVEWHNEVIRLVASYVARGLADHEIHQLTDPLTLAGYTVEQTRAEVQTAINGARAKGWTPPPDYAKPQFDAAPAPRVADVAEVAAPSAVEWFADIEPCLTDSYLIKGFLGAGAMSVIYGPSNSGKTFFALDVAYSVAAGKPWRGLRVRRACVLYLAAEGGRGVANRIAALKQETGVTNVPFALRRAGLDLLRDNADLQAVYDLAQSVRDGGDLLIVIDTLSRVMAGGDENSAADMTALIRNIDAIREATGAHVMLVHHTGKDAARGARGHSSLRAATDTEIEVQATEDEDGEYQRAAMVTKQRDYQGGETFAFGLKSVSLGQDQDGDEVTSCVVTEGDAEEFKAARKAKKGIGGNQKIILETFDQMVSEGMAKPNPGGVGMPEAGRFWAVNMTDLRDLAFGKFPSENKRDAWRRAWTALADERGILCAASDLVWRTDKKVKS